MHSPRLPLRAGTSIGPGEFLLAGPFHPSGCSCCGVRSPLVGLGRIWREHVMGRFVAGVVVAMSPDDLARAYAADDLARARFVLRDDTNQHASRDS